MPNFYSQVQWTSDWCKIACLCRHHWRYFVQSWQKSNTCTEPRARAHWIVNVSVIIEPFHGNLSMLFLIPTLPKPTAYFSVISSRRLLNQENAHTPVCDMENFYAMPMYLFFNHWIRAWRNHMGCLVLITNVISEGSGEPAHLCNLVRVTLLTNSKFLSGWRLRPKQYGHLHSCALNMWTSILYEFNGFLSSPKRAMYLNQSKLAKTETDEIARRPHVTVLWG